MSLSPFSRIKLKKNDASSSGGGGAVAASSSEAGRGFSRKYTVRVSFAGLLAGSIILVIALGWVFAFGVIVGRGYDPEKKLPELARLLPPQEGQNGANSQAAEGDASILKPSELNFMTALKQRGDGSQGAEGTSQGAPQAAGAAGATASATAAGQAAPAQQKPGAAPAAVQPKTSATPEADKNSDKGKYDFVFQTAAFKVSSQADALRERLEGEGLRTRLAADKEVKGKTRWFRVQVLLRGTEADAANTKQILDRMGLKDSRITSRTAVGRSR